MSNQTTTQPQPFKEKITTWYNAINDLISQNYWSYTLSFARTSFALCTLLTLLFNSDAALVFGLKEHLVFGDIEYYSIFQIFNNLWISRVVACSILLLVISGYLPKISAVLHWWVAFSFMLSCSLIEGGDQIAAIFTLLLIPILFLDKRKNTWHKPIKNDNFYANTIAFCAFLAIKLQAFTIYFFASTGKFQVTEWTNGTAVYYWFSDSVFGLNENLFHLVTPLLKSPYLVTLLTWSVLLGEFLLALSIFYSHGRFKKIMFFVGILLHFSFAISFGLWSFFFAMNGVLLLGLTNITNLKKPFGTTN